LPSLAKAKGRRQSPSGPKQFFETVVGCPVLSGSDDTVQCADGLAFLFKQGLIKYDHFYSHSDNTLFNWEAGFP